MSTTSCCTYYYSHLYYNSEQQKNKEYYQPQQTYYYQPQEQQQNMNYNNLYPTVDNFAYSPLDNNVLQDDNFSIATASDFYYNTTSPSLLSTTQLTPYSTPSPQISTAITGDHAATGYYDYYNNNNTIPQLFAPVPEHNNNNLQVPTQQNKQTKKANVTTTTSIEKRHICPICSHRSKRRHNLVEHMLTHNPLRPKSFLCGHCSRPFARKYDMKRHEKIHTR